MAKYILNVNGEAYMKDEDRAVIEHFYKVCAKHVAESCLSIELKWFD